MTFIVTGGNTGLGLEAAKHPASPLVRITRLDYFIASAGVEVQQYGKAEDRERYLTINVVSAFTSAVAVLLKLKNNSAQFDVQTTITFVGSVYHIFDADPELKDAPEDMDMFQAPSNPEKVDMVSGYTLSKLIEYQCHAEFARTVGENQDRQRVVINIVSPVC
ncbi:hypothetical protein HD806DRAFT_552678 [Xylariaceae sp. AK1471]|nr:hypothetical protein HD806DRAFT_552678 [Xylariaceae sp. AK1471]